MKNKFLLIAVLGVALASCNMMNNKPSYQLSDLQGLWQENNTEHFVRFTTEQSDEVKYLLGREWDEAELHLMDNHGAEIPKEYIVSKLTSTDLEYYEKDKKSNKFFFSKVVEK